MNIKKFIKKVQNSLGLGDYKVEGKKKAVKELLKKLLERKREVKKTLEKASDKKNRKDLQEELEIVSLEIKKAKKFYLNSMQKKIKGSKNGK